VGELNAGDLWFDADDGNALHRWDGSSWQDCADETLYARLAETRRVYSGQAAIISQMSAPTQNTTVTPAVPLQYGDIWINTSDGKNLISVWSGSGWVARPEASYADLAALMQVAYGLYTLQIDVNGKIVGFGALNTGETTEFSIVADRFKFCRQAAEGVTAAELPVFSIEDDDEGTPNLVFVGNIFANALESSGVTQGGAVVASKVFADALIQLGAGGRLLMGDGSILQIASGAILLDGELGRIRVTDPAAPTTSDYVEIYGGSLRMYRYIAGQHRAHAALTRRESGEGQCGEWVYLSGYWASQPDVILTPKSIMSYDASYPVANQKWSLYVEDIEEYSDGQWRFKPLAKLELASGSSNISLSYSYSDDGFHSNIWADSEFYDGPVVSDIITSPNGTSALTLSVNITAMAYYKWILGRDFDITYFKRVKCSVVLKYRLLGSSTWASTTKEVWVYFSAYNVVPTAKTISFSVTLPISHIPSTQSRPTW
jgi:hypothetical protein